MKTHIRIPGAPVAAALLAVLVAGCGDGSHASSFGEPAPRRTDGRTSIVLVTVDTTRADHLGCYGNPLPLTPNIDALAGRGTVFENAYAPMPQTLPAHTTLFTGLEPRLHGALENTYPVPEHVSTLAELLSDQGYRTGGFIGAEVLSFRTGVAQGFDEYDSPNEKKYGQVKNVVRRPAADVTSAALKWARKLDRDDLFLLWVHYYDPHDPFDPPEYAKKQVPRAMVADWLASRRHKIRQTRLGTEALIDYWHGYAAEIRGMDEEIGRLLEGLGERGLLTDAHVVLVADHGEGLYEHGERGHGVNVYEELMRVPLIVADPDGAFAGRRLDAPVALMDVFPTVMELALGSPYEHPVSGRSLAPALVGEGELDARPVFLERPHYSVERLRERSGKKTPDRHKWGVMAAVVQDGWKLIRAPGAPPLLFDLSTDPDEALDLSTERAEIFAELERSLDGWLRRHPAPDPGTRADVSPEQMEALRALGNIGEVDDDHAGPSADGGH